MSEQPSLSKEILNLTIFLDLMKGQLESMFKLEKGLRQYRNYLQSQQINEQQNICTNSSDPNSINNSASLEKTIYENILKKSKSQNKDQKDQLTEKKEIKEKIIAQKKKINNNDSNTTSRIIIQNDDMLDKKEETHYAADNKNSCGHVSNNQDNQAMDEEEQQNSHTQFSEKGESQNSSSSKKEKLKKAKIQKKIKKSQKKFCISQNPSQFQTPKSGIDSNIKYDFIEHLLSKQLQSQTNNNYILPFNNPNEIQSHYSQKLNQFFSSGKNLNNELTPQQQIIQDMFQSTGNKQIDQFLGQYLSSQQQGKSFNTININSNQSQIPTPFAIYDNQNDQNLDKSLQSLNNFYQLYQEIQKQNQQESTADIDINNKQMKNSNPKAKDNNKQEISDELSSNNQESNSIPQIVKKVKKFPSVVYVEGNKKFQCQICQKTFDSKQKLGGHKARTHPDAPCQRTEREKKKKIKNQDIDAASPTESHITTATPKYALNGIQNTQPLDVLLQQLDKKKDLIKEQKNKEATAQYEKETYSKYIEQQILSMKNENKNPKKSFEFNNSFNNNSNYYQQQCNSNTFYTKSLGSFDYKPKILTDKSYQEEIFNQYIKKQKDFNQLINQVCSEKSPKQ